MWVCVCLWPDGVFGGVLDQVRHPSALAKFDHIVKASMGKQIVMFLDYDGTLSPIVDDPDSAFMSDQVSSHELYLSLPCFPLFPY